MKNKTFAFLRKYLPETEKCSSENAKKKNNKKKKKKKKKPSMRSFLTEKTPDQDILLPPISRLSRVNESQAIEFLPVCNSVKIILLCPMT